MEPKTGTFWLTSTIAPVDPRSTRSSLGSTDPTDRPVVAQSGNQPGPLQTANGGELGNVDHDTVVRLPVDEEGHNTVVAGLGVLAGARPTIDGQFHTGRHYTWPVTMIGGPYGGVRPAGTGDLLVPCRR